MAGVLLETWSTRKISVLFFIWILLVIAVFALGGYFGPNPHNVLPLLSQVCKAKNDSVWYEASVNCDRVDLESLYTQPSNNLQLSANDLLFTVRIPQNRFQMHRSFQFLSVSMHMVVDYDMKSEKDIDLVNTIFIDARVAYLDAGAQSSKWIPLQKAGINRTLSCHLSHYHTHGSMADPTGYYSCDEIPFMELGSVPHVAYLINIKLPTSGGLNQHLQKIHDIYFTEIHQNGGFTILWFSLKTAITPLLMAALLWMRHHLRKAARPLLLLEKAIVALGFSLLFMTVPVDWISLVSDRPFNLMLSDIRNGQFYGVLLIFWLIFAGEHSVDKKSRNQLKGYKWPLVAICSCSLTMLILDVAERGVQMSNCFHTLWESPGSKMAAKVLVILSMIMAVIFLLHFLWTLFRGFWHIRTMKKSLPAMAPIKQLKYKGVLFRFYVFLSVSALCCVMTVLAYILNNINEMQWKFDDNRSKSINIATALYTGVFGLWSLYVMAVLVLYAPTPSKKTLTQRYQGKSKDEEMITLCPESDQSVAGPSFSYVYQMMHKENLE